MQTKCEKGSPSFTVETMWLPFLRTRKQYIKHQNEQEKSEQRKTLQGDQTRTTSTVAGNINRLIDIINRAINSWGGPAWAPVPKMLECLVSDVLVKPNGFAAERCF